MIDKISHDNIESILFRIQNITTNNKLFLIIFRYIYHQHDDNDMSFGKYTFLMNIKFFRYNDYFYFDIKYKNGESCKYVKIHKYNLTKSYFKKLLLYYNDICIDLLTQDSDLYISYSVDFINIDKLSNRKINPNQIPMLYPVGDLSFLTRIYDLNEIYDDDVFKFALGHAALQ